MFTGIIEETGVIGAISQGRLSARMTIRAAVVMSDMKTGDSVSVNGVCLTVTAFNAESFDVDVMPETLRKTSLGILRAGSTVNLERALRLSDRLGGHLVSGHIDGTGKIMRRWEEDHAVWFRISAEESLLQYVVDRGSVALNGISLTVVKSEKGSFTVSIIPHTQQVTTLNSAKAGDQLNIECDLIARYLEKLSKPHSPGNGIDLGFLAANDFI